MRNQSPGTAVPGLGSTRGAIMSERAQKIRLGLFVIGCLAAIGVLVILFAKQPEMLTSRAPCVVSLENAPGVGPGTPVRRSGVKIGQVSGLELKKNEVHVSILIDKKYPPQNNEVP